MSADDTDSTLEAAREILFGAQHRVHDGRIAQIEDRGSGQGQCRGPAPFRAD
jgi:hypothetical protein